MDAEALVSELDALELDVRERNLAMVPDEYKQEMKRVFRALRKYGIIGDVPEIVETMSVEDLLHVPGVGMKSARRLKGWATSMVADGTPSGWMGSYRPRHLSDVPEVDSSAWKEELMQRYRNEEP